MSKMSRSEPAFYNPTLELFYRTMLACGYTLSDIAVKIEEIEQKHGISVAELHEKNGSKRKDRVWLTESDKQFFDKLAENWQTKKFCKFAKVSYNNLFKVKHEGWCSKKLYQKLQRGIKRWEAKYGLETNI